MKWSLDLEKYAKKCKEDINTTRGRIAMQCYKSIVEKTPVDTGRARGNWHVSIGRENDEVLERKRKGVVSSEMNACMEAKGDESIYIQNNLPYIKSLEYGHSKQAPQGMVALTMQRMSEFISKAIRNVT